MSEKESPRKNMTSWRLACTDLSNAPQQSITGWWFGTFLFSHILRKPASWLVAVCERSENRGCGGGWLPKGNEISPCPCVEREKTEHFAGLCTTRQFADGVGYRFPLGPPFWWPERPWGCIGKYNETAGKHDNDQRKSYKIPWKTDENGANARNKPWKENPLENGGNRSEC